MSWLALQIWIELLLAASLGGVAAWAYLKWRPSFGVLPGRVSAFAAVSAAGVTDPEGRVRIAELEAQVRVEREETEALRRKLAAGSANVMTPRAKPVSDEAPAGPAEGEGALAWRNRFLESKVRFLEGKLADAEEPMASQLPPPDENDEATRLRWRNRYLEGRVKYLEEELTTGGTLQQGLLLVGRQLLEDLHLLGGGGLSLGDKTAGDDERTGTEAGDKNNKMRAHSQSPHGGPI